MVVCTLFRRGRNKSCHCRGMIECYPKKRGCDHYLSCGSLWVFCGAGGMMGSTKTDYKNHGISVWALPAPKLVWAKSRAEMEIIMSDCIFCKIAQGEIPSKTIYEDEKFRVILDLAPVTKGHALILPKKHALNLFELSDETAAEAIVLAKKIAGKMREKLKCDGLNLLQNNGDTAGQTIHHFHIHVIPRYEGDGQELGWVPNEATQEELEMVKKEITE